MEPITLTALTTAIATIISTKALEKGGERLGEAVFEKSGKLVEKLRQKNKLHILTAEGDSQPPSDYGEAVLQLKGAAEANPDIAEAVIDVEAVVNNQPLEASKVIRELAAQIQSQPSVVNNFAKLAEEIKAEKGAMVAQSLVIHQQTNNYT
ncbi:hypothetical protein [Limnofasciculus baicalensis]|uniref:Uncharacterized protein n=1 Tax=Limnofasciculus baicalensis BBK-W-15 TaxID=2699891 RepID=A0AAE3KQ47_9CYAN|nr:hypothetical protein [Limnofasciculus baicalensis]MCP2732059.1 hypothetical protein [Limnofasciculus baicalensis BBK-W-15]